MSTDTSQKLDELFKRARKRREMERRWSVALGVAAAALWFALFWWALRDVAPATLLVVLVCLSAFKAVVSAGVWLFLDVTRSLVSPAGSPESPTP